MALATHVIIIDLLNQRITMLRSLRCDTAYLRQQSVSHLTDNKTLIEQSTVVIAMKADSAVRSIE